MYHAVSVLGYAAAVCLFDAWQPHRPNHVLGGNANDLLRRTVAHGHIQGLHGVCIGTEFVIGFHGDCWRPPEGCASV